VRNATTLLALLAEPPRSHTVTDLGRKSGLSLATTSRVMRSLAQAGLAEQHPRSLRYTLGPAVLALAESFRSQLPLLQVLAPYLIEVRNTTKATIEVSVLVGDRVVVIDHVTGEHVSGVFRDSAKMCPAMERAAGRVLLAHADAAVWKATVARMAVNPPSERDRQAWARSPYLTRTDDHRADLEVAIPIYTAEHTVPAALSATISLAILRDQDQHSIEEHLARELLRTASAVRSSLVDD
jgi:DNA-binding IclR family transcriptional regulator